MTKGRSVLQNSAWLSAERLVVYFAGFLSSLFTARYLGPANFGEFSLSTSIVAMASGFAILGFDRIVLSELADHPKEKGEILGTYLGLRVLGGFVAILLASIITLRLASGGEGRLLVVLLIAVGGLFNSLTSVDLAFLFELKSEQLVKSKMLLSTVGAFSKVLAVVISPKVTILAGVVLFESLLIGVVSILMFHRVHASSGRLAFRSKLALKYLFVGWPLLLALLLELAIQKGFSLIIAPYLSVEDYGQLMLAMKMVEIPTIILTAVAASIMPHLLLLRNQGGNAFWRFIEEVTQWATAAGILGQLLVSLLGAPAVRFFFGSPYYVAGELVAWLWPALFFQLSAIVRANLLVISGSQWLLTVANLLGGLVLLPMVILLLPKYGVLGAAISFVGMNFMIYILSGVGSASGRQLLRVQASALRLARVFAFTRRAMWS
ncbi:MAG: oligosaccharide flippase family protein [Oligoflexia bacterium]